MEQVPFPEPDLGPIGGPAVRSRFTLTSPEESLLARKQLFASVLSASPAYLPGVASGVVTFEDWYRRKSPTWVRVGRTPSAEPHLASHMGVRLNGALPGGELIEHAGGPRLSWELGMLVVRPGLRGCGLGSLMVKEAEAAFAAPLWASVHRDGPGYHLLANLGWTASIAMKWPEDPSPGLIMVSQSINT